MTQPAASIAPIPPAAPARAPLIKGWPILGVAWHMRNDPLKVLLRAFEENPGDAVFMKLGPYKATILRNPDHIKRVFVDNAANYSKQTRGYAKARIVLGDGLVTSEGELWQRQRRIATPAFHRQRIIGFASIMTDATVAMLDGWRQRSSSAGLPMLDVFQEMMRVTLRIALHTLLGTSAEHELNELSPAVSEVLERTNDIITNPLSFPEWVPTPKHIRFRRAIDTLDRFVYSTIDRRTKEQAEGQHATDLLSMLLAARDEQTGEGMSRTLLRDEAVTILIAGHETTAIALTWALYLVAKHPAAREALEAELDRVLAGRTPTVDDLPNLKYTRAAIEEAMRLYPPAWMIGRAAIKDDTFGPYTVRGGEFVLVSPFVTHRNAKLWDHVSDFDPGRFIDGRSDALPKFAYLPFGGGLRFCVGATFAMMEATLMLATIAQQVRIEPTEDPPVTPWAMITLRPRHGVMATLKWRRG
ncbi:cytochrome P450 [Humisphaera borealis]|uniref:Cytochrome P450 n=1 Tax=Humisphaera borealis TaxID=2807512 RepID=A0A7M2WSQ5_9BACT|nr:cytochrome P450 [Humisphaera borealis]QOV87841.1 cytochrome P450 [Humisphaera borealis]